MRRTGSAFQLHVDHWGGRPGRTHAPVPLYVSTRGYGVFIDSARYVSFNVATSVRLASRDKPPVIDRTTAGAKWSSMPRSDSVEALVPAAGADVLVFGGPTPLDAIRRYNLYRPPGLALEDEALDRVNRQIVNRLVGGGSFFLAPTILKGRASLRVSITNFRTTEDDLRFLLDECARVGRQIVAGEA